MGETNSGRGLVIYTVAVLVGLALLWQLRELVFLIYAGVLFGVLLLPVVEWVQRWHWGGWHPHRGLALAAVFVGGLILMALMLFVVVPPLWAQGLSLAKAWPTISTRALETLHRVPGAEQLAQFQGYAGTVSAWMLGVAGQLANGVTSLLTILLLTAYILIEGTAVRAWCLRLFPERPRQRLERTLDRAERRMRGWLFGQATLALCFGGSAAVVFGLLRLPDFYALALLAGLLNFVPFLGPFIAISIAAAVAWGQSVASLIGVLVYFALYQMLENGYLTPRIMRNAVNLSGLAVILALAVGATLGGVLGALLAVPSAALAAEFFEEYALHP